MENTPVKQKSKKMGPCIYMDEETHTAIQKLAAGERRNFSNMAEVLILEAIEERKSS